MLGKEAVCKMSDKKVAMSENLTVEQFNNLSYMELLELRESQPKIYEKLRKEAKEKGEKQWANR